MLTSRTTLTAIVLAVAVTVAQAQTTSEQDHASHHPPAQGSEQTQTPPAMPMGQSVRSMGMPEMMQSGRQAGSGSAMMGTDMSQMMERMQRMLGSVAGAGVPGTLSPPAEAAGMGQMMQAMGQMMGTMGRMMEERGMDMTTEPFEGRIAALKTQLGITDAQMPQWTAFADAIRTEAQSMQAGRAAIMNQGGPESWPDRLALHERILSDRLAALKAIEAPVRSLYAVLSEQQRHKADELIRSPMGMM